MVKRNIDEMLNEGVEESICDLCGTILSAELYCPSCYPEGVSFEGVTKEAHDKLKEQNALLLAEVEAKRMSLAQEIAGLLKARGFYCPKDYNSSDIISAVGLAVEKLSTEVERLRGEMRKIYDIVNPEKFTLIGLGRREDEVREIARRAMEG